MNQRITPKERNLLKGAIRRVFSRSDLRRKIIESSILKDYSDASRPRVKNWCECRECRKPTPKSYMQVDHVIPIVPINSSLEAMTWDEVVDRAWCEEHNLNPICIECHEVKTKREAKERADERKRRKVSQGTSPTGNKRRDRRGTIHRISSSIRKAHIRAGKPTLRNAA